MARQPRFTADLWVPHGELFAKLGVLIRDGKFSAVAALVSQNSVEFGNLCGAVIKSLTDAGYVLDDQGRVSGPAAVVKYLEPWGTYATDKAGGNRPEYLQAGVIYAVKFTVPSRPVKDATPQVTCTIALRPFGSGDVYGKIVADPKDFVLPTEARGAGGTTLDSIDFEPNQGKTFYFVFALGLNQAGTDANVLIQLPTPA